MSRMKKAGKALSVTGKALNYAATLGGSKAVGDARIIYTESYAAYQASHDQITDINAQSNRILEQIGESLSSVQPSILFCQKFLKRSPLAIDQNFKKANTLQRLEAFKTSYNSALTTGFGGAVGGATAVGAWTVVSIAGSASTGAAISGLSGVAAYNATMAWFGGGALAAGGAGMSGGMMVLGGIVAAPLILISSKSSYSKAKKINEENETVVEKTNALRNMIPDAEKQLTSLRVYYEAMSKVNQAFNIEVRRLRGVIYPRQFLSQVKQLILRLLKRPAFTDEQVIAVERLRTLTDEYLSKFDASNSEQDVD